MSSSSRQNCDDVDSGYGCNPEISHSWGQYSAYFSVPSEISAEIPSTCNVTFAQVIARHGGRFPTAYKSASYAKLIARITDNVEIFTRKYAFLEGYEYTLGSEDLTTFGKQQMVNAGEKLYQRYKSLALEEEPFYRAASGPRVVESALRFRKGFSAAKSKDVRPSHPIVAPVDHMVIIDEDENKNNTLSHSTCPAFEVRHSWSNSAEAVWAGIIIPPIQRRLQADLDDIDLSIPDTISLMDLCPFDTIASKYGTLSPFCDLFTEEEWRQYDYYQALNKYYGFSFGAELGPTQGVGWVAELIARLTNTAVKDTTNTNSTLDADPRTFPLHRSLYADFSHDNDMVSIYSAMRLYNSSTTPALSKVDHFDAEELGGFSASWLVPFAGRMYVEKMVCGGGDEGTELVRVLVNDRVVPLQGCGADALGRCEVNKWVASLGFAKEGGLWDQCYT